MNGRRLLDADWSEWTDLKPGDYARLKPSSNEARVAGEDVDLWALCMPDGSFCHISAKVHTIIEHEDGTITVSPSILRYATPTTPEWHGYLERGVWRQC